MTKNKNFTIPIIFNHFKKFKDYLPNPPKKEALKWVLHYLEKGEYHVILNTYGIRYLLISLSFLESEDEFKKCAGIINMLNYYNAKKKSDYYMTHITQMSKIE